MAGLDKLISKLDIDGGGKHGGEVVFSEQLEATEFTIFRHIHDYGCFSWEASGDYKSLSSIKSTSEILCHIDFQGTPDRLRPIRQIKTPKNFQTPKSTAYENKFPYSDSHIACIHVAAKVSMFSGCNVCHIN